MGLPGQERFTIEEVATRWAKPASYVEEMLRTRQFTHIILVGELIRGSRLTRHLHFDRALWIKHYGKKLASDRAARLKTLQCDKFVKKRNAIFAAYEAQHWKENFGGEARWERIPEGKAPYPTFYNIGPHEVANLWNPVPAQTEWTRPTEGVRVFIPLSAVKAVERKHGVSNNANAQQAKKKDRCPVPDLSEIMLGKGYSTSETARFLGVTQKYIQNVLIPENKLKAVRRPHHWYVNGQEIRAYLQKYDSKS